MDLLTLRGYRHSAPQIVAQRTQRLDNIFHCELAAASNAIRDNHIYALQARHGLAQWSSRKAKSVTVTTYPVDDSDFNVSLQPVVLQAIITDDHIAVVMADERFRRGVAVWPHCDRPASMPGKHDGLITHHDRITVGARLLRPMPRLAAIATANDARVKALRFQKLVQPNGERCFTRAAHADIANDNDGGGERRRPQ